MHIIPVRVAFLACIITLVSITRTTVFAQASISHRLNSLTALDGLTSSQYNFYVFQDSRGYVWISSIHGLNRFDGYRIRTYTADREDISRPLSNGIPQGRFQEDRWGHIWMSNSECLLRYRPRQDTFQRIYHQLPASPSNEKIRNEYYFTYLDQSNNHLYSVAGDYLFVLQIQENNDSLIASHRLSASVKDRMFSRSDGRLDYLTFRSRSDTLHWLSFKLGQVAAPTRSFPTLNRDSISDAIITNRGTCWVATTIGLKSLDTLTGRYEGVPDFDGKPVNQINQLALIGTDSLLVNTEDGGLYLFDLINRRYLSRLRHALYNQHSFFEQVTDRITQDAQGNFWISTKGQGIRYGHFNKPKIKQFGLEGSMPLGVINDIHQGPGDDLWVLQPQRVVRFHSQRKDYFQVPGSGRNLEQTVFIYEDEQAWSWVGSISRLFTKSPQDTLYRQVNVEIDGEIPIKPPGFYDLVELPDGRYLLSSNEFPVLLVDELKLGSGNILQAKSLTHTPTTTRLIATDGLETVVCFSYNDTLAIGQYQQGQFRRDTAMIKLPLISSIIYDQQRNFFWVASDDGLYRLQRIADQKWTLLNENDLEGHPQIQAMVLDDHGDLWLSAPASIIHYQVGSKYRKFQLADGLQGTDFVLDASLIDRAGHIYMGGTDGLNVFHPDDLSSMLSAARPSITDILIQGDPKLFVDYTKDGTKDPMEVRKLTLPNWQNNLEIRFSALEYSAPQECHFSYALVKKNGPINWIDLGNDPTIELPQLAPGRYQLHLRASNSEGSWADGEQSLSIHVLQPFLLRWYSILSGFIFALTLVYISQRRRATRKVKLANLKTAMERLTLNPHVLFNGLTATRDMINNQDYENARNYLGNFSQYMRNIMANSKEEMIRLDEEIELLRTYLSIEQIRTKEKGAFSYHINIDENLDPFDYHVPVLLFQPFVENAVTHGLMPLGAEGRLQLNFLIARGRLICIIEDNGIGRKGSAEVIAKDAEVAKDHNGIATPTTRSRIKEMNRIFPWEVAIFDIQDLHKEHGHPSGTQVRFELDLKLLTHLHQKSIQTKSKARP